MNVTEPQSYQHYVSLPARMAGVLRSPRRLFTAVTDRPSWAAVLITTWIVTTACGVAFMTTARGQQALVDEWERTAIAFGQPVSDARYARFQETSAQSGPGYAALAALVGGPVLALGLSAAILAVFNGLRSGRASYGQVLAIVAHAGVILALRRVLVTPLNYLRETTASPVTLGLLFPMLDEASPPARFLGAIDLFVLWWVVVIAIGVSVLYRRSARSTTVAFVGAYVGFALILAIVMAVSGGTV